VGRGVTGLAAALFGAALTGGLAAAVAGWRGTTAPARDRRPQPLRRRLRQLASPGSDESARRARRWLLALLALVAVLTVSGLPVLAVGAGLTVAFGPGILPKPSATNASIERLEALGEWTRRLAEMLSSAGVLQTVIPESVRTCPRPLRPSVEHLAERIHGRMPLELALRLWADELADRDADLVATTLITNAHRGAGFVPTLNSLAATVESTVRRRRDIETDRAKPRQSARLIAGIYGAVILAGSLAGDYTAPYRTPAGQAVLAVILAGFFGCLLLMRALTATPVPPRLLVRPVFRQTRPGLMSGMAALRPVTTPRPTRAQGGAR